MSYVLRRFAPTFAGLGLFIVAHSLWKRHLASEESSGQVVLITGGSRGLGLELAREWGRSGAQVVICARTREDLERAVTDLRSRGYSATAFICDVTSQTDVEEFIDRVVKRFGTIDVLVNNAGIIQVGPLDCMTMSDFQQSLQTHLWGPLYAIEAARVHMRRQGGGRIVNIASIGGKVSVPHLLPYSVGKFALVGLSEGLRSELAQENILVTTVCPGLMRTGSPRNAQFKGNHRAEYAWFSISDSLPLISISSRRAAVQIVSATQHGRPYLAISLPCKLAIAVHGLFPGLTARILSIVNRRLPSRLHCSEQQAAAGRDSYSRWSPSALTWLNERAAAANNELRR